MSPSLRHAVHGAVAALAVAAISPAFADVPAPATPPAGSTVTAVQSPAWLVHAGATTPLTPGMQVADGDSLKTATGGRVYIDLPEMSRVKLGENTEFATPTMDMNKDDKGSVFKGVLHILKGVFRFTTNIVGKSQRRDVSIQVGVATIGLRGTDVWGHTGADGSLVALLEGKISMDMPGRPSAMMDQPMHYMMMPSAGALQENVSVTQANVADWAAQTDVADGGGVLTQDGKWTVALVSSTSDADTRSLMKKLADAGYPSDDVLVTVKGTQWHRLVIREAASLQDAKTIAGHVGKQFPLMSPWVFKEK